MGSVCADDSMFQRTSHPLFLTDLLSPTKLLHCRAAGNLDSDLYLDSPTNRFEGSLLLRKFLPYNDLDDDGGDNSNDPYSADHFRMYDFKVRRCTRSRSHDWTDCPFAHPGEKARRRDPRKFHYSGTVCADFRKGNCSRGDNCEFAHGVFECWLHPARYRTEACKDGRNCKRKVCFFAHTPRQLRVPPVSRRETSASFSPCAAATAAARKKYFYRNMSNCGVYCRSPTSTLVAGSPPLSPPSTAAFCRCGSLELPYRVAMGGGQPDAANAAIGLMSYEDALSQLVKQVRATASHNQNVNMPSVNFGLSGGVDLAQNSNKLVRRGNWDISPQKIAGSVAGDRKYNNDGGLTGIDLDWVNDLLT
ncbi:hypothetical protein DM860_014718 [Cuscuta australis]|uniref:C3H1-type domain-containing protein n=1 Tax=Cuscuta australis TaxID=267555 RepID=A0A328DKZ0_9ASTE|nr:hypothetical protein DM860_014718 [Cuscuta australis]